MVENSQVSAIGATGLSRRMASSGEPAIDQLETVYSYCRASPL